MGALSDRIDAFLLKRTLSSCGTVSIDSVTVCADRAFHPAIRKALRELKEIDPGADGRMRRYLRIIVQVEVADSGFRLPTRDLSINFRTHADGDALLYLLAEAGCMAVLQKWNLRSRRRWNAECERARLRHQLRFRIKFGEARGESEQDTLRAIAALREDHAAWLSSGGWRPSVLASVGRALRRGAGRS